MKQQAHSRVFSKSPEAMGQWIAIEALINYLFAVFSHRWGWSTWGNSTWISRNANEMATGSWSHSHCLCRLASYSRNDTSNESLRIRQVIEKILDKYLPGFPMWLATTSATQIESLQNHHQTSSSLWLRMALLDKEVGQGTARQGKCFVGRWAWQDLTD